MKMFTRSLVLLVLSSFLHAGYGQTVTVSLQQTSDGSDLGTVVFKDTPYGLEISPQLSHLSPGPHGFHLHTNPNCGNKGLAAGGHFDPEHTNKHMGPYMSSGHLGDLPVLWVNRKGIAVTPVLAPRLKTTDLPQHSLIVHAGGDNYSDHPAKLGGGGARYACAVIMAR